MLGEPTSAALSGPNGRCVGRPIIVWAMNDQLWTTLAGRRNSHTADLPGRDAAGTARSIKRNARGIASQLREGGRLHVQMLSGHVAVVQTRPRLHRSARQSRESCRALCSPRSRGRAGTIDLTTVLQTQQRRYMAQAGLCSYRPSSRFKAFGAGWPMARC